MMRQQHGNAAVAVIFFLIVGFILFAFAQRVSHAKLGPGVLSKSAFSEKGASHDRAMGPQSAALAGKKNSAKKQSGKRGETDSLNVNDRRELSSLINKLDH